MTLPTPGRPAATIAAAAAGGLLVWVIAVPLADVDLAVRSSGNERSIGPVAVIAVAVIAGLAAVGLAALLHRTTSRPRRNWVIMALVILVLSLLGPLGAATAGAGVTLAAMHLVVGTTLILGLGSTLTSERPAR